MQTPRITIVTPVYKTGLDLLEKAFCCLKDQTLGFDKIRWIVIIHNSGTDYYNAVCKLFEKAENVTVKALDDGKHGPSTPRNLGIEMADTEYVGFLDSDDTFEPECLEEAVAAADRRGSDITVFRRRFSLESNKLSRVTEVVLWNQFRDEILIDRDHWEEDKMFVGVWGMVTSRIYRREMLEKNHVRFEEDVPFGEDFLFNIEAYHHAEKILYLPRLIGYHYYINGTSLVQSQAKTADVILDYARGFHKLFSKGIEYGMNMNPTISRLCSTLSRFILKCPDMTEEKRTQIRDLLGGFIENTTRMLPNKIYHEAAAREAYELPRKVILYTGSLSDIDRNDILYAQDFYFTDDDPTKVVLRDILANNASTDAGLYYHFADILTVSEFRQRLPITGYDDYRTTIRLTTEIGEENVISNSDTVVYVAEADAFGNIRRFPCSKAHMRPYVEAYYALMNNEKTLFFSGMFNPGIVNNDNTLNVSAFGLLIGHMMNNRHPKTLNTQFLLRNLENLGNKNLVLYCQLIFALQNKSFTRIIAANTRNIYDTFCMLEKHHAVICDDIEKGSISGMDLIGLEPEFVEVLKRIIRPNKERADELRGIFSQGFDEPVAKKIWPWLKNTVAKGYGSFRIYTDNLRRFMGNLSNIEPGIFCSEVFIAGRWKKDLFKMDISTSYYEFIPFSEGMEDDCILSMRELEVYKEYRLVVTTETGLYRYKLDDVIRVEGMDDGVAVISYAYDVKNSFYIGDLYFTEKQIYAAVCVLREEKGLLIEDYSFHPDSEDGSIYLYLELRGDGEIPEGELENCEKTVSRTLLDGIEEAEDGTDINVHIILNEPETSQLNSEMVAYRNQLSYNQMLPMRLC